MQRPLSVLMADAVQRLARFFSQHAGKTVPWDRSALSSFRRVGLALLKLRGGVGNEACFMVKLWL